jgi:2-desacetyl-2-hydroxyethyl bacteriochlorophyllide A dehydrogenase
VIRSRALLVSQTLALSMGERELADPIAGEALVRVEWVGVCGSDLHVLRTGDWVRSWPATPGHEFVGVVVACPGEELAVGTRVVVDSRVPCGACEGCARQANLCQNIGWVGEVFPGGLQELVLLPTSLLVACPAELEPELAVLAEPLAVARHAVGKVTDLGRAVLILGYGPIGMLLHAELVLRRPGIEVTVVDPSEPRRDIAAAFGAIALSQYSDDVTPPDVVFDAAGYATSLADSLDWVRNGGQIVVVALGHTPESILPAQIAEKSVTIHGANGFADDLPEAVARLAAEPERFRALITDAYPLSDAPEVLATMLREPSAGKVVFRP